MGRKRITQTKLGEILGIPQASIYRRLNGKISFSFNELLIIASYMGITVGELVGSGLLNAKSSTPLQVSQEGRAGKKIAPVEMISTGATYEVVAGAGFEPATSGLHAPIWATTQQLTQLLLHAHTRKLRIHFFPVDSPSFMIWVDYGTVGSIPFFEYYKMVKSPV